MTKFSWLFLLLLILAQYACTSKSGKNILQSKEKDEISDTDSLQMQKDSLQKLAETIFKDEVFEGASFSFVLYDPSSGQDLISINPNLNLTPASVTKVITTAAALEMLGEDFRFETKIYYTGSIENQVLKGDLLIRGGGDPTLGSIKFNSAKNRYKFLLEWVRAIKKLGITAIDGNIIADASVFDEEAVPTAWQWEDIAAYYGTAASGLSVFDNNFSLTFNPQRKGKYYPDKKETKPFIPGLSVTNSIRYSSGEYYLDILGAYFSHDRIIKGIVPKNKNKLTIRASIPDPPLLTARYLETYLEDNGIAVFSESTTSRILHAEGEGIDYSNAKLITTTLSPPLSRIVKITNKESNNLFAEHLLQMIGFQVNTLGYVDSGVAAINAYYLSRKVLEMPLKLYDGNGIARKNKLTAHQLVKILSFMQTSEHASDFVTSLPVSGTDGTLTDFCNTAAGKGKVLAKSGTMGGVRTYAGYLEQANADKLVFALMVNNFNTDTKKVKLKLQELLEQCILYLNPGE